MRGFRYFLFVLISGGALSAQPAPDAATAVASRFLEHVTRAWEARDGRAYAAGAETMFKYILEKRGNV